MLMLCYLLPECNPSFFFFLKHVKILYLSFFFFQSCTISASPSRIYVGVPFLSVSVFSQDQFFSVVFNCFSPDLLFQAHARQSVYL